MTLRRAEWHRTQGKERVRKLAAFISNPFNFTKKLLGDKRSGNLKCPTKEVDSFLHDTLSDPERDLELEPHMALKNPKPPAVEFSMRELSWSEVQDVVKRAQSASAPGPSGLPYTVYKCYPQLLWHLWKILKVLRHREWIVAQWRYAEGVWILKEENSKNISQFSLLSVEGKVFFSILSRRLIEFLLKSSYIGTTVERWDPWCTCLFGTHWSHKTHQGGTWGNRRPDGAMAGPYKCVWIHTHWVSPAATSCIQ